MQVLNPIDPGAATGSVKQSFDAVERRLKRVPNMLRLMANSPAILGAYLQFNEAFEHTRMTPKLRGLITVAVSELNGCERRPLMATRIWGYWVVTVRKSER